MALLGQASGGFTESSSALRILHVGIRNTVGVLTDDSFTQTNPPITATGTSSQVDTTVLGVLSGSIAFTRPDGGSNYIGGPLAAGGTKPLGIFINTAVGNSYENTPGTSSGKGPYVSAQGCYANNLFESANINSAVALTYTTGEALVCSVNGYLTNVTAANNSAERSWTSGLDLVQAVTNTTNTLIGILKMPADATQDEIVYDQRV
jgi:hypothetical protein